MQYTITSISESAVVIRLLEKDILLANEYCKAICKNIQSQRGDWIRDIIPSYTTVMVVYDVMKAHQYFSVTSIQKSVIEYLDKWCLEMNLPVSIEKQIVKIPVCYEIGLDIEEIAHIKKCTPDDIIEAHSHPVYTVFMIGFLPGFAYMGSLSEQIQLPRKPRPRSNVTAGSVAIAGCPTGMYPLDSPVVWNVIGKTPLKMFNPECSQPCLLKQGDSVQFYAIDEDTYH